MIKPASLAPAALASAKIIFALASILESKIINPG
jgi:hypothetical protein